MKNIFKGLFYRIERAFVGENGVVVAVRTLTREEAHEIYHRYDTDCRGNMPQRVVFINPLDE